MSSCQDYNFAPKPCPLELFPEKEAHFRFGYALSSLFFTWDDLPSSIGRTEKKVPLKNAGKWQLHPLIPLQISD
jgi:hypothetical protein